MTSFSAESRLLDYVVAIEGIDTARDLESLPAAIRMAAVRAVNTTVARTRTDASRRMREQVAFPARYLDSRQDGRLAVTQKATRDRVEGRITGRFRPTTLARFARNRTPNRRGGVTVEVAPGFAKLMRRAFIIRLRGADGELGNLGLAIRLRPGETIENKRKQVTRMKNGLSLLYGPSVDQVFRTVAGDVAPDAAAFLETEFLRLLELDDA
ncbi:hypothetical protein I5E68_09950 [Novosphingobium sp. YJ-S2-02]|uniref:Uncharacterized protein n=1 Tax=Novosphingobium aureum TaxID=2792964 RepID=A0A931HD34_9SPHN|nr:hypothetical protein [Novosphingobium aureum]MBH0113268.1 hypothetical protein [Novosphingobium aureum]